MADEEFQGVPDENGARTYAASDAGAMRVKPACPLCGHNEGVRSGTFAYYCQPCDLIFIADGLWAGMTIDEVLADRDAYNRATGGDGRMW